MRRTKADALQTRESLLDAAETLFAQQGVSRTSLQDIARAAGCTRGAIYWHFKDKADLFNAMMARTTLPMEDGLAQLDAPGRTDPLADVLQSSMNVFHQIVHDPRTRRVFDIATLKIELVAELDGVRRRHIEVQENCAQHIGHCLTRAQAAGRVRPDLDPAMLTLTLLAIVNGLIQNWMLEPGRFDLCETGRSSLTLFLDGIRPQAGVAR
ncbi:TetR family transcriptional regulator [Aquabacterium olei]|uniref:TetR family transcriptional regulator n=1 Tax=Aquabacterium olei TaxID=1296669 RepID=A0A2U8FUU3_9BURK|nr:TetR family transcriptional regulator [Aquabacterium olei]AWI54637.1 TetR family transcriptional regulator [Aquabacterium olei]